MSFAPLGARVLIRQDEAITKVGRVYIPDAHARKPTAGTVVACGPDARGVKVGERVWFKKYSGNELEGRGILVEEEAILGVVDP